MSPVCQVTNDSIVQPCPHMHANLSNLENITSGQEHDSSADTVVGKDPGVFVVPVVFAVIFIVGIIGNGTLIFIVLRNKVMRSTPNAFIVSLAVGDLLLILVSVPFSAITYIFQEWIFGVTLCKVNEFLQALSLGVSVFTLTALSGDRYVAIVHPMRRHKGSQTIRTLFVAGGIWLFSICLGVLELVASRLHDKYEVLVCSVHPLAWGNQYAEFHTVFRFVIYFALPMSIITFFYLSMSCVLWRSGRRLPGESPIMAGGATNLQARQLETRKKVAKLVLSLILVFMVCWLPRHIYLIWYYLLPGEFNLFWYVFKMISFCLCFLNSCVNPLALYVLSEQFREYYNYYLCCCLRRRRPEYSHALCRNEVHSNYTRTGNMTTL